MEADDMIVKSEFSSAQDLATRMAEDTRSEDHRMLLRSMASEASCFVLVKSIPLHLDAWVILNSETRLTIGLTAMSVLPVIESNNSLRSASLEYSGITYAEAFMYRSAQPLLEKYGIICSIVSRSPRSSVAQALRGPSKIANGDQAGCSTHAPSTLNPEITPERRTPTPDTSDDECIIVSSRTINPSRAPSSFASKLSTNATPDTSASTKAEPLVGAAPSLNNISMIQPLVDPKTSSVPVVEAPASPAPEASTAEPVIPSRENNTNTSAAITTAQQRFLLGGIQRLSRRAEATYFAQPVSFNQMRLLDIPHYPDIIKKPMDLRTMEEKLKFGKYASIDDYVSDFDQMVENSVIFNGPRHEVTKDGFALKASFEKQITNSISTDTTKGPVHISGNSPRQLGRPRKWRNLEQEMARSQSSKRGRELLKVSDDAPLACKSKDSTFTPRTEDRLPKRKKPVRQAVINGAENLRLIASINYD
ncbi:hypothetical protein MMC17_006257 [Xylographa soralifera]|nr:hypothetical protein [Xylographa soralifera]